MGLVWLKSARLLRLLERLFGSWNDIEFIPKGERAKGIYYLGVEEEFTLEDSKAILKTLGFNISPFVLYNLMRRGGWPTWADIANRINEIGGIRQWAWWRTGLSVQVAEAIVEYGLLQGLLLADRQEN